MGSEMCIRDSHRGFTTVVEPLRVFKVRPGQRLEGIVDEAKGTGEGVVHEPVGTWSTIRQCLGGIWVFENGGGRLFTWR